MASSKNPYGKTALKSAPYFTIERDGWEWRVLKLYKAPAATLADPSARALCAVRSPHTFGTYEYGDTYVRDVPGLADAIRLATIADASVVRLTEFRVVEYHSRRWLELVCAGWVTVYVQADGMARMIRETRG